MNKGLVARWIGLGLGTLTGAVWAFVLIASLIGGPDPHAVEGAAVEGTVLTVLALACLLGVGLAWWRARLGGAVLTVAALALCIFAAVTAGQRQWATVLISGAPFLVAGVLLVVSRARAAEQGRARGRLE